MLLNHEQPAGTAYKRWLRSRLPERFGRALRITLLAIGG
jgi:hypothetical protein